MVESSSQRLFIAIAVPDAVKAALCQAQNECRATLANAAVRWTPIEHLHATLQFLGNVGGSRVVDLTARLEQTCGKARPIEMRCEGLGVFPPRSLPRVIWAGIQDKETRLPEVRNLVVAATREFTIEDSDEHFTGHITLARCKEIRRKQAENLSRFVQQMSGRFFGHWQASEVVLMRSELSSTGAKHSVVAKIPLRG